MNELDLTMPAVARDLITRFGAAKTIKGRPLVNSIEGYPITQDGVDRQVVVTPAMPELVRNDDGTSAVRDVVYSFDPVELNETIDTEDGLLKVVKVNKFRSGAIVAAYQLVVQKG